MPIENKPKAKGNPKWKKGVSGNPGGRPKTPEPFKQHGPQAVRKIIALMQSKNPKIALAAAQLVAAYAYGKPAETHNVNLTGDLAVEIAEGFKRIDE